MNDRRPVRSVTRDRCQGGFTIVDMAITLALLALVAAITVSAVVKIAEGAAWNEAGLPGDPIQTAHDIRSYYEELAVELADGPPGPWAAERWFYDVTQAGQAVIAARRAMKGAEAPFPLWFYMAPGARP